MDKVYIVTTGCYSDYAISAVFSTEEKAKKYCRYNDDNQEDGIESGDYTVNEWDIDKDVPDMPKDMFPYEVKMDRDVDYLLCEKISFERIQSNDKKTIFENNMMYTRMLAMDEEHAIKIANERRAMFIANNQWGKD
jgi:hypothetical protein